MTTSTIPIKDKSIIRVNLTIKTNVVAYSAAFFKMSETNEFDGFVGLTLGFCIKTPLNSNENITFYKLQIH